MAKKLSGKSETKRTEMKKSTAICKSLGLKQEEMAMLLNITRAQWSMFESGSRGLPKHALPLFAELLAHMNSDQVSFKIPLEDHITPEHIMRLIKENEYMRLLNAKKIAALEKKLEAEMRRSHLVEHLKKIGESKKAGAALFFQQLIKNVAPSKIDAYTLLANLKLKLELLEYENKLLISKLTQTPQGL